MASRIKVAVLDDYQGLSTGPLSGLSSSKFDITTFRDTLPPYTHPSTSQASRTALTERLAPFEVICTMRERTPFPADLIKTLPNLKVLLTTGMRNKGLDLDAFREAGIKVYGTPNNHAVESKTGRPPGPDSTTQHCIALILGVVRNLAQDDANVKNGLWQENVTTGLSGKTFGCVGFGRLGVSVAKIMYLAFGMEIAAWSSSLTAEQCAQKAEEAGLPREAFKCVSKEQVMASDVVSVHYVLSDRSRGIVGKQELSWMKPSAFLINTSRGPLVDEAAALAVLKAGKIRGAAIDVYDIEPLPKDSEWRTTAWGRDGRSHVLLSPHMGYVEIDSMQNMYENTARNLERYAEGKELESSML